MKTKTQEMDILVETADNIKQSNTKYGTNQDY